MSINSVNQLYKKILWFPNRQKFDIDYFDLLQPRRTVSLHPRYRSGVFYSDKCGREIQYESALELKFIELLERYERVVFYWEQPVRISYWRGRKKQYYTPDFAIYFDSQEIVLAEVKDLAGMLDNKVQIKAEALMDFCSRHGFGMLLTDGKNTPSKLIKGKVNRKLEKELISALETGVVRGTECREIMERCGASQWQLYRAIIRHELKFCPFPLKIQKGNRNMIFRQVFFDGKKYEELEKERYSFLFGNNRI